MELIYKKPPMEKIAGVKVPDNPKKWTETIIKEVNLQYPFLSNSISHVSMEKADQETGYAVGHVVIKTGDQKSLLPFTIREFHLDPIDVFIHAGEYYPLSKATFQRVHFDAGIAETSKKKDKKDDFGSGADSQDIDDIKDIPRFLEKSSSIIGEIKDTIYKEDISRFKQGIKKISSVASLYDNPATKVIERILSIPGTDRKSPIEKISSIINDELFRVKREENGTYSVESTPRNYYHPTKTNNLTKESAASLIAKENPKVDAEEAVNQAKEQGEAVVGPQSHPPSPPQPSPGPMAQEDIGMMGGDAPQLPFGYYMCQTVDGNIVKGWIIPKTYDFGMNETGNMLFTNGEISSFQPSIAARPAEPESEVPMSDLQGGNASFFAQDGSAALCTTPFKIISMIQTPEGTSIRGESMEGGKVNFLPIQGVNSIIQVGLGELENQQDPSTLMITDGANYYVPMDMQAIKVGNLVPLISDEDMMQKMSMPIFFDKVRVVSLGSGEFSLQGRPIEKLSSMRGEDTQRMDFGDARWYLMLSGLTKESSEGFLKRADKSFKNEVTVIGPRKITTLSDVAMKSDLDYDSINKLASVIRSIRCNLIKEAAAITNENVADKILSLNFINPDNLQIFVDYLEDFREVSKKLAKLLLASRIGLTAVDEKNTKSAMEKLDSVISQLEVIEKSL